MLKQATLKDYLVDTLRPFKFLLNNKHLSLKIDDSTNKSFESHDKINTYICTDFKIYEEILFHLMANACKFSPENAMIGIAVELKYEKETLQKNTTSIEFPNGLG